MGILSFVFVAFVSVVRYAAMLGQPVAKLKLAAAWVFNVLGIALISWYVLRFVAAPTLWSFGIGRELRFLEHPAWELLMIVAALAIAVYYMRGRSAASDSPGT